MKHQTAKIETLRAERAAYAVERAGCAEKLRQVMGDIATTRTGRALTETRIASSTKGAVYVDAKLLDGTAVRMEAHQLLLYQINELERLETARATLDARLTQLRGFEPGVNQAALIIQARYGDVYALYP
ncbi:hypothetical protein PybrP1_008851 [[Pythium] brassicae (nom. inval.)]|nr:hypothetical protein PybrP1_008851 [[Pythium] brassicae (nom. inval.)]